MAEIRTIRTKRRVWQIDVENCRYRRDPMPGFEDGLDSYLGEWRDFLLFEEEDPRESRVVRPGKQVVSFVVYDVANTIPLWSSYFLEDQETEKL